MGTNGICHREELLDNGLNLNFDLNSYIWYPKNVSTFNCENYEE